ncbi:hypothetical protein U1Q18_022262, partial [Sarracenia purpurea var. burkii]
MEITISDGNIEQPRRWISQMVTTIGGGDDRRLEAEMISDRRSRGTAIGSDGGK